MKNRVKELRDAKHLTQTGLALKVGSTQQTISKIEREIGVPKLDLALIMADFFNVTLEYLSRMMGNYHVRFLGEGRTVMLFSYPTMPAWKCYTTRSMPGIPLQ